MIQQQQEQQRSNRELEVLSTQHPDGYSYIVFKTNNNEKAGGNRIHTLDIQSELIKLFKDLQIERTTETVQIVIKNSDQKIKRVIEEKQEQYDMGYNKFIGNPFLETILDMNLVLIDENSVKEEINFEEFEEIGKTENMGIKNVLDQYLKYVYEQDPIKNVLQEEKILQDLNQQSNTYIRKDIHIILKVKNGDIKKLHQKKLILYNNCEPLYLNFHHKIQDQQEIDFLTKLLNQDCIEIKNVRFGSLNQDVNENYNFNYYYNFQEKINISLDVTLGIQFKLNLIYDREQRQYIHLLICLDNNFTIKLSINLSLCHFITFDNTYFYIKLVSPPKFYANRDGRIRYRNIKLIKKNYIKIDNFITNFLYKDQRITDLQRLLLINNYTIAIQYQESNIKTFKDLFTQFNLIENLNITQMNEIKSDQTYILLKSSKLPFQIQYCFLAFVSQNKITLPERMQRLIKFLRVKSKDFENTSQFINIVEQTFIHVSKLLSNINSNINETKQNQINYNLFEKTFKRMAEDVIFIDNVDKRLAFVRKITITPSGIIYFQKQPEETSAITRKYYKILEHFLRVQFLDENQDNIVGMPYITQNMYFDMIYPSIKLLSENYQLFTWSSSQLRNSQCWFINFDKAKISRNLMISELGNFNNLAPNEYAKNAARLGQNLSSSKKVQLSGKLRIQELSDSKDDNEKLYTDGIGKIAKNLIDQIRNQLTDLFDYQNISALQIRYEGAKGVLALNTLLKDDEIFLRKSMIKYNPSTNRYGSSMEILDYNKYRGGYLNRQIIILLISLGVKDEAITELFELYIKQLERLTYKDSSIYKYFNVEYNGEFQGIENIQIIIQSLLNMGETENTNVLLRGVLDRLKERGLLLLRTKTNILVEKAARVLGVVDEYQILKEGEIYCKVVEPLLSNNKLNSKTQNIYLEGKVLVTRNPCLHPGDIRVLQAVSNEEVIKRFNSNPYESLGNCVVFAQKGKAVPCQIAGGDLDGDIYFVSWDERLIPPKTVDGMVYDKIVQQGVKVRMNFEQNNQSYHNKDQEQPFNSKGMTNFLLEYLNSDVLGKIDNSHLAIADFSEEKAFDERCSQLAELHGDAVDFVKHGRAVHVPPELFAKQWPDYMEKDLIHKIYESQTVIGKLYRKVVQMYSESVQPIWRRGYECDGLPPININLILNLKKKEDVQEIIPKYLSLFKQAISCLSYIQEFIYGLTELFQIKSEYEIYSGNYSSFTKGDGLFHKKKLNTDNIQKRVIQQLISLKLTIHKMVQSDDKLYLISLMNLLISYSPSSHSFEEGSLLGYFYNELFNGIKQYQDNQSIWEKFIKNYIIWYRGSILYLFWKELKQIHYIQNQQQQQEQEQQEIKQQVDQLQEI